VCTFLQSDTIGRLSSTQTRQIADSPSRLCLAIFFGKLSKNSRPIYIDGENLRLTKGIFTGRL
jgi:hypothetical protein